MIQQEIENFFSIYLNSLIVNKDGRKIFEGYDGLEFGIFSKEIVLPTWFKIEYVPEMCLISNEW